MKALPAKPSWVLQEINDTEAKFITDLIDFCQPTTVIEIGVGSGWSSLCILQALAALPVESELISYDIRSCCAWNELKATGSVVNEVAPHLLPLWSFRPGNSATAAQENDGLEAGLAFIDADHAHPWPTLDLLALLAILSPGSWVVLHDIEKIGPKGEFHGAKTLFETWPEADRQRGYGEASNIGAVRIPLNPNDSLPHLRRSLTIPWEMQLLQTIPFA